MALSLAATVMVPSSRLNTKPALRRGTCTEIHRERESEREKRERERERESEGGRERERERENSWASCRAGGGEPERCVFRGMVWCGDAGWEPVEELVGVLRGGGQGSREMCARDREMCERGGPVHGERRLRGVALPALPGACSC